MSDGALLPATHDMQPRQAPKAKPLATVAPAAYRTAVWYETLEAVREVASKRRPEDPDGWAEEWAWRHYDEAELRALGFCHGCGAPIVLRQIGRSVYSAPCGHYRAQGELKKIVRFLTASRAKISLDREQALLTLIGRA